MNSTKLLVLGIVLVVFAGLFVIRSIRTLVDKKDSSQKNRVDGWFDLVSGFSPLYIWIAVILLGLVFIGGGLGIIHVQIQ